MRRLSAGKGRHQRRAGQDDGDLGSERGSDVAENTDKRTPHGAKGLGKGEQFRGGAGFRDEQDRIARLAHAQISVGGIGGVQEDSGGAGALESGGELLSDVAGLADAGEDDLAGMSQYPLGRAGKRGPQAAGGGENGVGFRAQGQMRGGKQLLFWIGNAHIAYRNMAL